MKLFTLDKKLIIINHRLNNNEIIQLCDSHKLTIDELKQEVRKQMLFKVLPVIDKSFETNVTTENDSTTISINGYVLSQRELYETLLEVLELDAVDNERLTSSIKNYLGMT